MTRQPKARDKVLQAARRIVESKGAGHLTFDELATESGVTRGGITYHFPTKEALLKALIETDMAQWDRMAEDLGATSEVKCPKGARLLGHVRCSLAEDDDAHRRFVTGLLSAAMVDPGLLDPIRSHVDRKFADWRWDDADLERYLLLLAADGLFWSRLFAISPLPEAVRPRLAALIETKVKAFVDLPGPAAGPSHGLTPDAAASPTSSHSLPTSET